MLGNVGSLETTGEEVGVSLMIGELGLWGDLVSVACMGVMKPGLGDSWFLACGVMWKGCTDLTFKSDAEEVAGSARDCAGDELLLLVLIKPVGMATTVFPAGIF